MGFKDLFANPAVKARVRYDTVETGVQIPALPAAFRALVDEVLQGSMLGGVFHLTPTMLRDLGADKDDRKLAYLTGALADRTHSEWGVYQYRTRRGVDSILLARGEGTSVGPTMVPETYGKVVRLVAHAHPHGIAYPSGAKPNGSGDVAVLYKHVKRGAPNSSFIAALHADKHDFDVVEFQIAPGSMPKQKHKKV
jgi:hypothetical protein